MTLLLLGTHAIQFPYYVHVADDVPHTREMMGDVEHITLTKPWTIDIDFEDGDVMINLTTFGD